MATKKTSDAQLRANEKWKIKNRDKQRIYTARSRAKAYINNMIETQEEIDDLLELLEKKSKEINKKG
ncbi:hypothetical protein [Aedoeadaptatus coxii]|uniref:hypothetical protein n=1 Tax=Aedoeadaptatus coxii TaxID=755172 RepID=UPI002AD24FEE|nr:hypothetical protein [Peptoniphilus coxii]